MSTSAYFLSLLRLLLVVTPALVGARAWRRLLAPHFSSAMAGLADAVGAMSGVLVVSELLGSAGAFRDYTLLPTLVVLGLASRWWCEKQAKHLVIPLAYRGQAPSLLHHSTDVAIVASCLGLVCAQWSGWVASRFVTGIGNFGGPGDGDSLWYHMPLAGQFVQSGWTSHIQFTSGEALTSYYPANTAVLHALGLLTLRSDTLSVFINLGLALLALLAGWCIGEGYGVGAATLAGVAVALVIPVVAAIEAGTAKDDVLGLFGLLAAVAFVVHPSASTRDAPRPRVGPIYGGLAAGLALGSKLTLVAPVAALTLALGILTPRASRQSVVLRFAMAMMASGSYWYFRNFFTMGNPLPGLRIGFGHFHLPRPSTPSIDVYGADLLHVISRGSIWRSALIPGLRLGLGTLWPLVLATMGVTIVVGIASLRRNLLAPPITAALALGAFVVTPGTVWATQLIAKNPYVISSTTYLFAYNVRYLLPALAIGLATVPLVAIRWRHGAVVIAVALGSVLAATEIGGPGAWAPGWTPHFRLLAVAVGAVVFVTIASIGTRHTWQQRISIRGTAGAPAAAKRTLQRRVVIWLAVLIGLGAVGLPLQRLYLHDRYKYQPLAKFAATRDGAHIGYSGFVFSYPLYGAQLQNEVEMLGTRGPDGSWHPVRTCLAWRREIRAEHLQYVVVPVGGTSPYLGIDLSRYKFGLPTGIPPSDAPESGWTKDDPGARLVFDVAGIAAYSITGPASAAGC